LRMLLGPSPPGNMRRSIAPSVVGTPAPHAAAPYRASGFVLWPVTRSGAASGMHRNAPARWRSIRTTPRSSGSSSTISTTGGIGGSSNQTWRPSSNQEARQREIASRKVLLLGLTGFDANVAAVTGGMGRIGQGIVIALTQRDFDVVVCDRTIDPAIAERITTNAAPGARLSFIRNDLADPGDLPRFVDAIFTAFGHIECLVNNAGLSANSLGDLFDAESYDLNFAVNARGAFFLTQAVCKKMLAAEGDFPESARSVVFISSSNAVIAAPERVRCPKRRSPDG
jgi:short chain dehydrogenase